MASSLTLFVTGASTGLLAGGASCAAVQGGLLASAVVRRADALSTDTHRHVGPFAPIGAFLLAKLVSHTLLGAALGVLGAAIQPGPRTQATLLIAAALLMVLFALDRVVTAKAGIPTTLVVATSNTGGCVRSFVVPDLDKQLILEPTGEANVDLGTPEPGTLSYSCGMGMYGGRIVFGKA